MNVAGGAMIDCPTGVTGAGGKLSVAASRRTVACARYRISSTFSGGLPMAAWLPATTMGRSMSTG